MQGRSGRVVRTRGASLRAAGHKTASDGPLRTRHKQSTRASAMTSSKPVDVSDESAPITASDIFASSTAHDLAGYDHVAYPEDDDDEDDDGEDNDTQWQAEAAAMASRFESLVSLAPLGGGGGSANSGSAGPQLSQAAGGQLKTLERKAAAGKQHTGLTRDERATVDQVLDPRTRLLLFKLINTGTLTSINGCVSTGKEANVYHAFGPGESEFAVKVYKTSILVFRDRDRYVSGEFRFRHGYCKSNPRKMVRMWAEKEMRNYRRLALANVPCPSVHLLREHVLLMGFLGRDGLAAPRLKDAHLSSSQYADASRQTGLLLRRIYQECKLVHADFSEYNLLWYAKTVYVIDVSQAVEHDHPNALVFLRKDCENAIHFFRKNGVPAVPDLQPLFNFVVDPSIRPENAEAAYDRLLLRADDATGADAVRGASGGSGASAAAGAEAEVAEAVFAQMHIPRTMEEVGIRDVERDIATAAAGRGADLAYAKVMGLGADLRPVGAPSGDATATASAGGHAEEGEEGEGEEDDSDDDDDDDDESDDDVGEEGEEGERRRRGRRRVLHKEEDKDEKRERKAAVKAAQREARTHKTPKHVKKAKAKAAKKK